MKICVAQIASIKGNIQANIDKHFLFIQSAIENKADLIVFPELSISGYYPSLAKSFTDNVDSPSFDLFQAVSDRHSISISIGLPRITSEGITISMVIFQPRKKKTMYSKQQLHSDELSYFVEGTNDILLEIGERKVTFGICYETLMPSHFERARDNGAEFLIASVAKSQKGIEKAGRFFTAAAREFNLPVIMSNCIGACEGFIGAGQSAIWNSKGEKLEQLDATSEGILVFDTSTNSVRKKIIY